MIKYNNNTINKWAYGNNSLVKMYHGDVLCYYVYGPQGYRLCYAVVDDISQYIQRDYDLVYDRATSKYYCLNNLDDYEEYGVMGTGRDITTYTGKLTVDNGYEYEWNGTSWVNLGEVTGSTVDLPNVPFTLNVNAKRYDATTQTLPKTTGQLADTNIVISGGSAPVVHDDYITIDSGTRGVISGYQTYFNRSSSSPTLTIISKQRTQGSNCHLLANRSGNYNWMYRPYSTRLTLHGSAEKGEVAITTQPVICSARVDDNRLVTYNNYTDNTTSSLSSFSYGSTNNGGTALFAGYSSNTGEWFTGDFYWIYVSQTCLTNEQIQQVIAYNEEDSMIIYPKEYDEKSEPPSLLTFNTLQEADEYAYNNCVYDGMLATINGEKYEFDENEGWVYKPSRLPSDYTEVEYIENTTYAYLNLNAYIYDSSENSYKVETRMTTEYFGTENWNYLISTENTSSPYIGMIYRWDKYNRPLELVLSSHNDMATLSNVDNGDGTSGVTITCSRTSGTNNSPLSLFCGIWSTGPWRNGRGRFYYFKLTKNNVLIRDLVPCIRDNDSMVGMYDLVNDVFYYPPNYASYQLVAGSPV